MPMSAPLLLGAAKGRWGFGLHSLLSLTWAESPGLSCPARVLIPGKVSLEQMAARRRQNESRLFPHLLVPPRDLSVLCLTFQVSHATAGNGGQRCKVTGPWSPSQGWD